MKKTLVAAAALAFVGAASAQSTVTLYGKIDWHIQNQSQKTAGVKTAARNPGLEVNSAGLSGSRWGMKGSEDLGGGLRAVFDLQSGFNIDAGSSAQGGLLFGRQAFMGLAGGFGTFTVGRQYSPLDNLWGTFDAQGYTTNSAMGYAWNGGLLAAPNGLHADAARINNSLFYMTPAMGGFVAQAMYAPSENRNPVTGQSAGNLTSFLVGYGNGPLNIQGVWERTKVTAAAGVSTNVTDWTIGASYDLGVAKVYGGYQRASSSTLVNEDRGWMLGVSAPVGPVTISFGYARETVETAAAFDGKNSAFGGQVVYALSKRTNVYADFLTGKNRPSAATSAASPITKNNIFGVGMRHDF